MRRFGGPRSLLSMLIGIHRNRVHRMGLCRLRGRLRRSSELAHRAIPARMDTLVVSALKAQQGRGQNRRGDKRNEAPQQITGGRRRSKEMTQEQREATLGTAGATGQGNSRAKELKQGARGHAREKVAFVVAKGKHQEIRHEVEKRELQHGDDHREQHGRKVAG